MNHFKDKKPKQTIKIIYNFFIKKGYNIYKQISSQSCAGTYFSHFILYFNNKEVLSSNGKGITRELCEASGLAELYERFCFFASEGGFVSKKIFDIYQNRSYQLISKDNFFKDNYTKQFCKTIFPKYNKYYFNLFIKNFYNNNIFGNKFINLQNHNDIIYKESHMLYLCNGTTGLAAGNTLEEALVQGSSEIYERLTINYFYKNINNKSIKYFEINKNILPFYLQKIIKNAEKNDNCKIKIFDLSFNYNLPVILIIHQDLLNHTFYFSFGSHPIFNIAVERCLTELYQGQYFHEYLPKQIIFENNNFQYQNFCEKQYISNYNNLSYIPKNLLLNSIQLNYYNKKIYFSKNKIKNNSILLKYISIINNLNNLNFYYSDISLTDNIKAVQIITKEILNKTFLLSFKTKYNKLNKQKKNILFYTNLKIINFYNKIITKNISDQEIKNFINDINKLALLLTNRIEYNKAWEYIITNFCNLQSKIFNIYTGKYNDKVTFYNSLLFFSLINNLKINNSKINNKMTLYPQIQQWDIINNLIKLNYSKFEINKILNFFNFNNENFNNNIDNFFILKQLIKYIYEMYNNQEYHTFIKSLKPKIREED